MAQVVSLRTENKFKKTEIGEIPVEWGIGTIDECCEILDSQRVPLNDAQRRNMRGPIPYYGANGLIDHINDYLFDDDLILMAEDGGYFDEYRTRPISYMVTGKCWVNNHAHILKAKEGWDRKWIYYSVVHKNILPYIAGGTRSKLTQADLKAIQIAAPPLDEQKKIAEILSAIDRAIEKIAEVIEKIKQLKKGLMHELLTRGIGHKKFKKSELGEMPEEWVLVKLKGVGDIITGNTPSTKNPEYYNADYPWATPSDLGEKKYIETTLKKLSKKGMGVSRPVPGSSVLVVCIGSTIGKVGMAAQEMATNQQINSIVCDKSWNPHFVYYWLCKMKDRLISMAGRQAVPIVNKTLFSSMSIPKPHLSEQNAVSGALNSIDEEIEKQMAQKTSLENLKKGLMQVLLTGRTRARV